MEGLNVGKEVDAGASVSVCNQDFYGKKFKSLKLFPTDLSLYSYTNTMFVSSLQKC